MGLGLEHARSHGCVARKTRSLPSFFFLLLFPTNLYTVYPVGLADRRSENEEKQNSCTPAKTDMNNDCYTADTCLDRRLRHTVIFADSSVDYGARYVRSETLLF